MTPEEAKARLRDAAQRARLLGWVEAHPWRGTLTAFVAGLVLSSAPGSRGLLRRALAGVLKLA